MLEADTLSNRIAIVAWGHLKVVATQQRLNDTFGSGYHCLQLNLVRSTPADERTALSFVRRYVHLDAALQTLRGKTLRISLPRELELKNVLSALYNEEARTEAGINQFLLSQSSLEDMFLAIGD